MNYSIVESPSFMDDLVVYELTTKNFNSPGKPQSGTFRSVAEKLEYLRDLGATGIWLNGHQWCQGSHFYNIWAEYACIRPDVLDPSLGTEDDFKALIEKAHGYGIKVFLDVITHGLMSDSPLIQEKPEWFQGGSWGMTDFDWYGGHKDLDQWWVDTWLHYILHFGVDGFRLDIAHYRGDLWAHIRRKAREAGHEIMIMLEAGPAVKGVSDVLQHGERISDNLDLRLGHRLLRDAAGYLNDRKNRLGEHYIVQLTYTDGTTQRNSVASESTETGTVEALQVIPLPPETRRIESDDWQSCYEEQFGVLRVENVDFTKEIAEVKIYDAESYKWKTGNFIFVDYHVEMEGQAPSLLLKFSLRQQDGQYISNHLSSHDNGWEGTLPDANPYAGRGSRYVMGYGCFLTPTVPVFMSGEEFNADFVPVPSMTPDCCPSPDVPREGHEGEGKWLCGSWIHWEQLKQREKAEVLEDVKAILAIRHANRHLIRPYRMNVDPDVSAVKIICKAERPLPVPYGYVSGGEALVVAANPSEMDAVRVSFDFDSFLDTEIAEWEATVLFGPQNGACGSAADLTEKSWEIAPDKQKNGGLLVLKLRRK